METKILDLMLALHLRSVYTLSRAVIAVMLKQKRGSIVTVAAKAALDHGAGARPLMPHRKPLQWR
jgi:NAD(P)-dependent dehydrogenase (short-subunit alcohol dehydrogenase family)